METTLKVSGMTCQGCVNSVKKVLEGVPGVTRAEVSLEQGNVTVWFDPALAGIEKFRTAIEDAGYEA
jgi:copper chaperone